MIQKLEAYFMKDFIEKGGALVVFAILMFIPVDFLRGIFMILMITIVLSHIDPYRRRKESISELMALPFSYSEIFWFPFVFLVTIVTIIQLSVGGIIDLGIYLSFSQILHSLIFLTAYYGIFNIFAIAGLSGGGFIWLFWVADMILGSIGPESQNLYRMISPIFQGNEIAALLFAVAILVVSFYLFSKKGVTKRWQKRSSM
ncbi:hypothetical protein [Athalassotoga saccharophila]|uniref:hypothetical protein n=1 Tax=Athalassotoga saccharophila TaxID=1441386 RepID=UPI00137A52FE|nr:hypothetical protein [Athalassotoga saccharophila]BBJ28568.1 hypothetical protein ATHSA_1485 [Athalassotoga saccharophila]